jgi:hypothetical protein
LNFLKRCELTNATEGAVHLRLIADMLSETLDIPAL